MIMYAFFPLLFCGREMGKIMFLSSDVLKSRFKSYFQLLFFCLFYSFFQRMICTLFGSFWNIFFFQLGAPQCGHLMFFLSDIFFQTTLMFFFSRPSLVLCTPYRCIQAISNSSRPIAVGAGSGLATQGDMDHLITNNIIYCFRLLGRCFVSLKIYLCFFSSKFCS